MTIASILMLSLVSIASIASTSARQRSGDTFDEEGGFFVRSYPKKVLEDRLAHARYGHYKRNTYTKKMFQDMKQGDCKPWDFSFNTQDKPGQIHRDCALVNPSSLAKFNTTEVGLHQHRYLQFGEFSWLAAAIVFGVIVTVANAFSQQLPPPGGPIKLAYASPYVQGTIAIEIVYPDSTPTSQRYKPQQVLDVEIISNGFESSWSVDTATRDKKKINCDKAATATKVKLVATAPFVAEAITVTLAGGEVGRLELLSAKPLTMKEQLNTGNIPSGGVVYIPNDTTSYVATDMVMTFNLFVSKSLISYLSQATSLKNDLKSLGIDLPPNRRKLQSVQFPRPHDIFIVMESTRYGNVLVEINLNYATFEAGVATAGNGIDADIFDSQTAYCSMSCYSPPCEGHCSFAFRDPSNVFWFDYDINAFLTGPGVYQVHLPVVGDHSHVGGDCPKTISNTNDGDAVHVQVPDGGCTLLNDLDLIPEVLDTYTLG